MHISPRSQAATAPEQPLFFLHIRKTAGVSVRSLLFNRFAVRDCLLDCHHVGNRGIDPADYRFVTGHVGYDYVARFARRPLVFTVLRRPIECALSAYFFFRSHDRSYLQWLEDTLPSDQGAERVRFTKRANELPLLEFLQQEPALARALLGNTQTRALLGAPIPEHGRRADAELLAEAAMNLESCDVIGLTERLDESLAVLGQRLGWSRIGPSPQYNITRGRAAVAEIDPRALDILRGWNQLDAELYRIGERCFARDRERMSSEGAACGFADGPRTHLPHGSTFTFDQAIHGGGWYPREKFEQNWLCWMGAERQASIDLRLEGGGEHTLQCRGVRVLRPSVLDGLEVSVNGHPLAIRQLPGEGGLILEMRIPACALAACQDRARIVFTVRETFRPSELVPGTPDSRSLGIALGSIHVTRIGHIHG